MTKSENSGDQSPARVTLVCPPFASTRYPSMALSLLKPLLQGHGIQVNVIYLNLLFAEVLGQDFYESLVANQSHNLGEQAFGMMLHPELAEDAEFRQFVAEQVTWQDFETLAARARHIISFAAPLVQAHKPDIVGFTTTFFQKMSTLALCQELKQRQPNITTVLGGAAADPPMGDAIWQDFDVIDYVIQGDAEESFPDLVSKIKSGGLSRTRPKHVVDGIIKPRQTRISQQHPDYTDYLAAVESAGFDLVDSALSYEASRGCWWGEKNHCTFCGLNGTQMTYRKKPSQVVIKDLAKIGETFGQSYIQFTDNIVPHDFFSDVLPHLASIPNQTYFMEVKSNLKTSDFEVMKRSGVTNIQPGIERLTDDVLKLMKKGASGLINLRTLRLASEHGIAAHWNVLVGFTGEDSESVRREIDLIKKITHLQPPESVARIRMDRYSPNFDQAGERGFVVEGPSQSEQYLFYGRPHVDDMAYHFQYRWATPPNDALEAAWRDLEREIAVWKNECERSSLVSFWEGDEVVVQDMRTGWPERELVVTRESSSAVARMREIVGIDVTQELVPSDELDQLIEAGIVVQSGNGFLWLPTHLD